MTRDQWSRLWMWLTFIPAAFFAWVLLYGVYLGVSGKQPFSLETSPPETQQQAN